MVLSVTGAGLPAIGQSESFRLEPGKPIERGLKGGEVHTYQLAISSGQYLHAITDQRGIDVVVSLFAPDGKPLLSSLDRDGSQSGKEPLWFVSDVAGTYVLEIRSPNRDSAQGLYQLRIEELRATVPDDKIIAAAGKAMNKADIWAAAESEGASAIAVERCKAGAEIFRRSGDHENQAFALLAIGRIYQFREKPELAIDYNQQALKIFESLGSKDNMAGTLGRLGAIFESIFDYPQAMECYERAMVLAEATGHKRGIAYLRNDLALLQMHLGAVELARENYEKSLVLAEEISMKDLVSNALHNLGNLYLQTGNYVLALDFYQRNLSVSTSYGDENRVAEAMASIGNIHSFQGNNNQAFEYYEKALAIFEKMKDAKNIAATLGSIGDIYVDRNEYAKALDFYNRSNRILSEKGFVGSPVNLGSIGHLYRDQGNYRDALAYFQKALDISYGKDPWVDSWVIHQIARTYFEQGDFRKSLEFDDRAIELAVQLGLTDFLFDAYALRGRTNFSLGREAPALRDLQEAIAINERVRFQVAGGADERTRFFENRLSPYYSMVELLVSQNKQKDAFSFAEKAKSRSLLDLLQYGKADVDRAMTVDEKERERHLRIDIASLNIRINESEDPILVGKLRAQLEKARQEMEDFRIRLYAVHPELRGQRGDMRSITTDEAVKLLPNNQSALLEYVVADDKTFLFVLTQEGNPSTEMLNVYPIDVSDKDLTERVGRFRSGLDGGDLGFGRQARELFNLYVLPAKAQLKGKTNLIIVPDAALWNLPFQALMDENGKYLIEKAAVSYAPSLTALREMQKKAKTRKPSPNAELLAFGNPIVGSATKERVQRVFMSEKLEPIPEAVRLVNELGKMYGPSRSKVFTGAEAREEVAKTESPKYRIVQFATHGILNNVSPMYSHLVLAQNDKNPDEDGLLEAWELKDLDLKADMVILSACDTARGKIANGEGIIGMTWASFIAGAPTTVATQWKVESSSATEMMLEFHRQLLAKRKVSKAEALRRASLKLLRSTKYRHPSYWAPWVLVGDGS